MSLCFFLWIYGIGLHHPKALLDIEQWLSLSTIHYTFMGVKSMQYIDLQFMQKGYFFLASVNTML
jgi:hypothetical protein